MSNILDSLADLIGTQEVQPTTLPEQEKQETEGNLNSQEELEMTVIDDGSQLSGSTTQVLQKTILPLTDFSHWMSGDGRKDIPNIRSVKANIAGVDIGKYVLLTVSISAGQKPEEETRDLHVYRSANEMPVIDLPALNMNIFPSGWFRIVYQYNDTFIKCYGGKINSMVAVFMNKESIPYEIVKISNKNMKDPFILIENNYDIDSVLKAPANIQALSIIYPSFAKSKQIGLVRTNEDVVSYFRSVEDKVFDPLHLMKIDEILVGMIQNKHEKSKV